MKDYKNIIDQLSKLKQSADSLVQELSGLLSNIDNANQEIRMFEECIAELQSENTQNYGVTTEIE